ncbi:MAG TPA: HPr family phosphocarrier protein [Eubacterium sp.]|jgi:catabolite repression HPr-like protein|nr:HPr family phosphocarrier protein [Eubacterium sp.]HBZ52782.1 HPr family phosphocarrier protein [Eubacterium sp.]
MIKKTIQVELPNKTDITPNAMMVQIASQYDSKIYVESDKRSINVKSIMGMMTLIIKRGEAIDISCDGQDEEVALEALEKYLTNK